MVQGLGATSSIMVLLLVNLIGYTVGISGTYDLVDSIVLARDGQVALATGFMVLFSGVQVSEGMPSLVHDLPVMTAAHER